MEIAAKNSCKEIAVDFDGTLYDRTSELPFDNAPDSLKWFRRWGYTIIIFSARATNKESIEWMSKWLNEFKIVFDEITNIKPSRLTWVIDDRGIWFNNQQPNWQEITEAIKKQTFPWKL